MKRAVFALAVTLTGCAAGVPNGRTRTADQWREHLTRELLQRSPALSACFAAPASQGRKQVRVAIRGPLRTAPGTMPGSYSGWGHVDAQFYVGQLPLQAGAPQPPDDEFNRCLASALGDIRYPFDENNSVDASWLLTYQGR